MIARAPENTSEPIPAGTHLAICSGQIDLGDQYNKQYDKYNRQVLFMWELPEVTYEKDGKAHPRTISNTYTLSLAPKSNLLSMLQSWRGKAFSAEELTGFDLKNVLKKACLLTVIHNDRNGRIYADMAGLVNLPASMIAGEPETVYFFDMDIPETYDVFEKLPEWIQKRIKESSTYREKFEGQAPAPKGMEGFTEMPTGSVLPF